MESEQEQLRRAVLIARAGEGLVERWVRATASSRARNRAKLSRNQAYLQMFFFSKFKT